MPRRIDVELTSRREDGTWTWRAAGAREPRGALDGGLLPGDAQVGNVLRAEVEMDVDGIVVIAVIPQKAPRAEPPRLQIIGPQRGEENLVTTSLVRRGPGERRPRRDGDRPPRDRDDRGRGDRPDRGRGDRPGRPGGPGGPGGPGRPPREDGGDRGAERRPRPGFERRPPVDAKPRAKRLRVSHTHRQALVNELPEVQRPIAEELAAGGLAGVRAAIDKQNEQARSEGRPEIEPGPLMTLAEQLWPRLRSADWRDRAEAALADADELDLRDLRSVVVGADTAARDDETREMATKLRETLTRRVDEEHTQWLVELAELVAEGRVVAALRRSSRPPKAGALLPADLSKALADRTTEALNSEVSQERWAVLVDALAYSPVRTLVKPTSVPENPSAELLTAVRRAASRLVDIAALFGVQPEPAPAVGQGARRGRPGAGGRPSGPPAQRRGAGQERPGGGGPAPAAGEPASGAPVADSPVAENAAPDSAVADSSVADSSVPGPRATDASAADAAPAGAVAPSDATGPVDTAAVEPASAGSSGRDAAVEAASAGSAGSDVEGDAVTDVGAPDVGSHAPAAGPGPAGPDPDAAAPEQAPAASGTTTEEATGPDPVAGGGQEPTA